MASGKTWSVGDVLTAAEMNSYVGDNFPDMSATPPASPVIGDHWRYRTGGGAIWDFVYDTGEATYKWVAQAGGGYLVASVATDETFTDDGSVHDATTVGPTVTLPFAGDWWVEWTANLYIGTQSASSFRAMGAVPVASSGTFDCTGSGNGSAQVIETSGIGVTCANFDKLVGASAGATVKLQYACTADTGTAHVRQRMIRVRPARVTA